MNFLQTDTSKNAEEVKLTKDNVTKGTENVDKAKGDENVDKAKPKEKGASDKETNPEDVGKKKLEEATDKAEKEGEEKEKKNKKKKMNWGKLISGIISGLIELIVLFVVGARVLFACKIAQFNILPTDINCMPYRPNYDKSSPSPDFQTFSPEASIDTMYVKSGEESIPFATKIKYEINDESMKFKILDFIRKIEYKPKVGSFVKYAMVCITHIFVFFYGTTSFVYNKLNEHLPEWAIILLGPFILSLFLVLLVPVTLISSLVISLINMKWLLHKNMNTDDDYKFKSDTKPIWMYIHPMSSITNLLGSVAYIILGLLFAFNLGITPVPYLIGLISFLSPLFMSAIIASGDKDDPKKYGFKSSIKGIIETKMTMFVFLFGFMVISTTAKHGTLPAVIMVSLATAYVLYRQYTTKTPPPKTSTSDIASTKRNMKFCAKPKLTKKELMEMERDKLDLAKRFDEENVVDKLNELKNKTQSQAMKESVLTPQTPSIDLEKTITPSDLPTPSNPPEAVGDTTSNDTTTSDDINVTTDTGEVDGTPDDLATPSPDAKSSGTDTGEVDGTPVDSVTSTPDAGPDAKSSGADTGEVDGTPGDSVTSTPDAGPDAGEVEAAQTIGNDSVDNPSVGVKNEISATDNNTAEGGPSTQAEGVDGMKSPEIGSTTEKITPNVNDTASGEADNGSIPSVDTASKGTLAPSTPNTSSVAATDTTGSSSTQKGGNKVGRRTQILEKKLGNIRKTLKRR
jgi:hypothetical protein